MIGSIEVVSIATVAGAIALGLLVPSPRHGARARALGVVAGAASLGLFGSQLPGWGGWLAGGVVSVVSVVTLVAAVGTISSRNPIHAALWFGLVLLGTAGLFLVAGAQFLAVATVSVYAGAILVTFLFVLMLAQPEGRAPYDRASTEPLVASAAGAVMVGILSVALGSALSGPAVEAMAARGAAARAEAIDGGSPLVHFGRELFGRHLIAVEVAGVLLFVALVGAVAIAAHVRERGGNLEVADREPQMNTDEHR
ncbi:MAG: NADH-quinone oxidoreductase subunit J [Pirellulales bacterium]|nr:NADH-quinone oxidoreductase subunit J [Pirellulales bacterium]